MYAYANLDMIWRSYMYKTKSISPTLRKSEEQLPQKTVGRLLLNIILQMILSLIQQYC